jgi:DNA invertase Pin-like site-specific DNA recombinase
MHEDNVGYRKLAKIFEISRSQVRNICKGIKRSQTPHDWKTVHLLD